jgi:arsenate reductase
MAEGYLRHFAEGKAKIYSAGIETHGVNPKAVEVMRRDGIDISAQTSNNVNEYLDIDFDYVITVCDNANEACPFFPGSVQRFHQNFPDPARATGAPDVVMMAFEGVRTMIKDYCEDFVRTHIA